MKNLGIGFVVIVMLVLFALGQRAPKDTAQVLPNLPSFALAEVAGLVIQIKGQPLFETKKVAKKEGDQWLLVDSETPTYLNILAVDQLLHDLQTMKVKRVVVRKTELFQRFAVDENEVMLKDKQGNVLLDVFVGKPATDLVSTYIRLADDKRVLTVDKILTWQVKRTPDAWLDKKEDSAE